MSRSGNEMRIRTTEELAVLCAAIEFFLIVTSIIALFLVKTFGGAALILLIPLIGILVMLRIIRRNKNAVMMNVIDVEGVKNQFMGETLCDISWGEIGDFGVAEIKRGLFEGRYIYMSRVFVQSSVRKNIVQRYDPRVCIVFPYTSEVCRAVAQLSGGRIDVR